MTPIMRKAVATVQFCKHQTFTSPLSTGNRLQYLSEVVGMYLPGHVLVFLRMIPELLALRLLNEPDINQHYGTSVIDKESSIQD